MTTKQDTKITDANWSVCQRVFDKYGARKLATGVLNLAANRRVSLSIHDLPDLPCAMYFRDEWQETWEDVGLTRENLECALSDAFEIIDELMRD